MFWTKKSSDSAPGRPGQRGMTLIDTLVAIGVLGVGLGGLAAAMLGAISASEFSKQKTIAINDAKGVIERLTDLPVAGARGVNDGSLLDEAWDVTDNGQVFGQQLIPSPRNLSNEAVTVTIEEVDDAGNPINPGVWPPVLAAPFPNALLIRVRITWTQGQRPANVTVSTVKNMMDNPLG